MRSPLGLLLLLVLTIPLLCSAPIAGQDAVPPPALGAPVQTVVDALPQVVARAIQEAAFDGTPDAAEETVRQMRAFTSGFTSGGSWPAGTAAAEWPVNAWLLYAVEVVEAAADIPGRVAAVERTGARCDAWAANATVVAVTRWGDDVRRAQVGTAAIVAVLDDLVVRAPNVIDPAPLVQARERLSAWLDRTASAAVDCVVAAEQARGIEAAPVLVLRAAPTTVWPFAVLRFSGGSSLSAGTAIRVVSDRLGLDADLTLDQNGTFSVRHEVPADVPLGRAVVHAQSDDGVNGSVAVNVVRIPTRLLVAAPRQVEPGSVFEVRIDVVAHVPGPHATGNLTLSGVHQEIRPLVNGTTEFLIEAPHEDGTVAFTAHYPGTGRYAPASTQRTIAVGTTDAMMAAFVPDETTSFDRVEAGLALAVVCVAILAVAALPRLLRRRAPPRGAAWDDAVPPPLPATGPLVRVFALFHAWAVQLGWARPSDTAREMAAKTGDERVIKSAHEFERVRYGGEPERPERSAAVAGWLRRVWGERTGRGDRRGG